MPLTKKEAKRLVKLIKKHTQYQVERSWAGSLPPKDQRALLDDAVYAHKELAEFIVNITED